MYMSEGLGLHTLTLLPAPFVIRIACFKVHYSSVGLYGKTK